MAFQKGHPGYKLKGTKNRATLLREERRAIFEDIVSQDWEERIKRLPDVYVADQYLGKAPDEIKHSGEIKTNTSITPELIGLAKDLLKKKLKDGQ